MSVISHVALGATLVAGAGISGSAPALAARLATGIVSGTFVTPDGSPLPAGEFSVALTRVDAGPSVTYASITGPGSFRVSGQLQTGQYTLSISYSGSANYVTSWLGSTYTKADAVTFPVQSGEELSVSQPLVLLPGGTISGVITSASGPVQGATITVYGDGGSPGPFLATSVADGTYAVKWLPPGRFVVSVSPPSNMRYYGDSWPGDPIELAGGGSRGGVDLALVEMPPLPTISGTVMISRGDGLEPYSGMVTFIATALNGISAWATSDANGYYTVSLDPGDYYVCFGQAPPWGDDNPYVRETCWEPDGFQYWIGDGTYGSAVSLHDSDNLTVDGLVEAAGIVTGTVRAVTGSGIATIDATVKFWRLNPETDEYGLQQTASALSWANPGFRSGGLPVGTYIVEVVDGSGEFDREYWHDSRYFGSATPLTVTEATIDLGEIVLTPRSLDTARITGTDRFGTSVAISRLLYGDGEVPLDGVPTVYLANGLNYPDALAAGPAAIQDGGVVLLTYPWSIPDVVKTELLRLRPQRVVVMGGTPSVSADVFQELTEYVADPGDVARVTGTDRFGTSRAIARYAFLPGGADVAFIATGLNYPDALAAGPPAGLMGAPIVLLNGRGTGLDSDTRLLLEELGVDSVYIIGGAPSVSSAIESDLRAMLGSSNVKRLTGSDRFGTAVAISQEFFANTDTAFLATALNFPDALAGGPAAAAFGAPLYLSRQDCMPPSVLVDIVDTGSNGLVLLGGLPSLSANVANLGVCP